MAAGLTDADWTTLQVCLRGKMVERKLWSRTVLWYETARSRPHPDQPAGLDRPWYTTKRAPSFADALATLRSDTWSAILDASARDLQHPQIATTLIPVLAHAA